MLFPWQKNRIEKRLGLNRNNEALIKELKIEGITENNVLYAIKRSQGKFLLNDNLFNKHMKIFRCQ